MFFMVTYDIASPKRLAKMLKHCRQYFHWVQMSVFEGELSEKQFEDFKKQAQRIIDKKEDSILCYKIRTKDVVEKEVLGIEKNKITKFF